MSEYNNERLIELTNEVEQFRLLLQEAKNEIEWWIDEHGCCDGHQGNLLVRIETALASDSGDEANG